MEMTNEKTQDLAEKVMGWRILTTRQWESELRYKRRAVCCDYAPIGFQVERIGENGPSEPVLWTPFTSRDDAHELLGKLTDGQWLYFGTLIRRQIRESGDYIQLRRSLTRCLLMLTPAQISEAVWRATCQP